MLKIKDNVDLKELEKFGFKECRDGSYMIVDEGCFSGYCKIEIMPSGFIYFEFDEDMGGCSDLLPTILLDLIQAGFVEKVATRK